MEKCLENDIRYSMRYLIDHNMNSCGWHELEVEKAENTFGVQVDSVYLAKSFPRSVERTQMPSLRGLGFSTDCYSPKGTPRPKKDPVAIISVATNTDGERQFVAENSDDKVIINDFVQYVRKFDPDIMVGNETNRKDWPYLVNCSRKLGINFFVDRAKTELHTSV